MKSLNDKEAQTALEMAKRIAVMLKGENLVVQGAAIGLSLSGWLMNHPPESRNGLAEAFLRYALTVVETMSREHEPPKH